MFVMYFWFFWGGGFDLAMPLLKGVNLVIIEWFSVYKLYSYLWMGTIRSCGSKISQRGHQSLNDEIVAGVGGAPLSDPPMINIGIDVIFRHLLIQKYSSNFAMGVHEKMFILDF